MPPGAFDGCGGFSSDAPICVHNRPDAVPILDEAADILKQHANVNVNCYCDAIGSVAYYVKLSQRRADAVVGYLESKGIGGDRLPPHGYGKTASSQPTQPRGGRNRTAAWS
jgi:OOP family OmpA-OmpF porin